MISNSTPLIIFSKLNKLDLLLKIFKILIIPNAVYLEVVENGMKNNFPDSFLIKDLIDKKEIIVKNLDQKWQNKSEFLRKTYQLGKGEAEAIALVLQEKENYLLIDDETAKKIAKLHEIKSVGSLKVLLIAFKSKLLTEDEVKEILTKMIKKNFRVSSEVINKFWILLDELKKK